MSRKHRKGVNRNEIVDAHFLFEPTAGAASGENIFNFQLNPFSLSVVTGMSGGAKLRAMSILFQYFRFLDVRYRIMTANSQPNPAAYATTRAVAGFLGQSQAIPATLSDALDTMDTTPVSYSEAGVTTAFLVHVPTVPGWTIVNRSRLLDQMTKWWKTDPSGAIDDEFEFQGRVLLAATTDVASFTVRPRLDVRVICEFKNFTGVAPIPLALRTEAKVPEASFCLGQLEITGDDPSSDRESGEIISPIVSSKPLRRLSALAPDPPALPQPLRKKH